MLEESVNMKLVLVFLLIIGIITNIVYGCGTPCSADSTSCCNRSGCGCVETLGFTDLCDAPCTYDDGVCCAERCDAGIINKYYIYGRLLNLIVAE